MTKTIQSEAPQGAQSNAPGANDAPRISPADMQAAVETARTEARAEGETAGRSDATARIRTILTCQEAEGRMSQAMVLALETDMAADDAARVLAASPKASPSATIADRAAQEAELGAETPADQRNRAERSVAGWSKAITQANARFG